MKESKYSRVAVYMGGIASERPISLKSGAAVARGLRAAGYSVSEVDVIDREPPLPEGAEAVFIALHGRYGEDGGVQNYLSHRGIPYTGAGPEASRRAFDKCICKNLLRRHDIPTADFAVLDAPADEPPLPLPVVVKPAREGSSIGIGKVYRRADWKSAQRAAFDHGAQVLVESCLDARELTVGIVGRQVLPVIEIVPADGYYDYNAKYLSGSTRYNVPAGIPDEVAEESRRIALAVYDLLECRGLGRIDFLLEESGGLNVLELNTIPGFTETSLLPKAAHAAGIDFPQLCGRIMESARVNRSADAGIRSE